jgi:hypothetical protein
MGDPSLNANDWIIGRPRRTLETRNNIFGATGISLDGFVRMLS